MLLVGGVLLVAGGGRGHDEDDAVPDISGRTVERQSVPIGERGEFGSGRIGLDSFDDTTYFEVAVRLIGVIDGDGHARVTAHIPVLLAGGRSGEQQVLSVPGEPHRVGLRTAVGPDGGQVGIQRSGQ